MSWSPRYNKGGLKGGFQQTQVVSPHQASPFRQTPTKKQRTQILSQEPIRQLISKVPPSYSSSSSSPSNSVVKEVNTDAAPLKECIHSALKLQFDKSDRKPDGSHEGISEQIENDVQRILEDTITFVAAKDAVNLLLTNVQKKCVDISKIPLVKFKFAGAALRNFRYPNGDRMCEKETERLQDYKTEFPISDSTALGHLSSLAQTSPAKPRAEDSLPEPKTVLYEEEKIRLDWPGPKGIGAGLYNLGNTCFLNATMQCLAYTPPVYNYFSTDNHRQTCRTNGFCVTCQLEDLLPQMWRSGEPIRPRQITASIKAFAKGLTIGRQEDAHEFLRLLIEAMRKSALTGYNLKTLDIYSQETTVASRVFGGFYRSRVLCMMCTQPSNVYDPFMDIPLDIGKNVQKLEEALAAFTRVEHLNSPSNLYKCEKCKKMTHATKQVTVHKAPNVLTLQLKRFLFSSSSTFSKIDKPVSFPDTLDLQPFMSSGNGLSPVIYKLYAVLVHQGGSCHSGHYFSYVKSGNGQWYRMDDTSVTSASLQSVLNQRAYLLFYTKLPSATATDGSRASISSFCPPPEKSLAPRIFGPLQNGLKNGSPTAARPTNLKQRPSDSVGDKIHSSAVVDRPIQLSSSPNSRCDQIESKPIAASVPVKRPLFTPRALHIKPKVIEQSKAPAKPLVPYGDEEEDSRPHKFETDNRSDLSSNLTGSANMEQTKELTKRTLFDSGPVERKSPSPLKVDIPVVISPPSSSPVRLSPEFLPPAYPDVRLSPVKDPPCNSSSDFAQPVTKAGAPPETDVRKGNHEQQRKSVKRVSRHEKKMLKKLGAAAILTEAQGSSSRSMENGESKKKKKKKNKKRKRRSDSRTTDSMDDSPNTLPLWVEKDCSENVHVNGNRTFLKTGERERQPEPMRQDAAFDGFNETTRSDSAYGSEVRSWSGGISILDQETQARNIERRKRTFESDDTYDSQLDEGRVKKVKRPHRSQLANRPGYNGFQRAQDVRSRQTARSKSVRPGLPADRRSYSHRRSSSR